MVSSKELLPSLGNDWAGNAFQNELALLVFPFGDERYVRCDSSFPNVELLIALVGERAD